MKNLNFFWNFNDNTDNKNNSENNKNKDIASVIIKSALAVLDYNNNLNPEEYYSYINGGKDNLSAAVYVKKRK